jgi:hypothetical protein
MPQVLAPTPTRKDLASLGLPRAKGSFDLSGTVDFSRVAAFDHLEGREIHCFAGNLWVTVENDPDDHILGPGQRLLIAAPGKVVIGGRGGYAL